MKPEEIKAKLHQYIDDATDEELEEMLFLLEEDNIEYGVAGKTRKWWEDEEFIKELDRRNEEIDSGKVKGIPAEEVHNEIREMLRNMSKK
jgi:hypothetical protein